MPTDDADTSLHPFELVRLLANSFKRILFVVVMGGIGGGLTSQFVHPRWTATMALQIGQVSIPAPGSGTSASQPLENQLTAAERCNLPSSRLQVLGGMGLPNPDSGNRDANLIFESLKATAGRSPSVINIQVSAYSREKASAALDAALKTFSTSHGKLFEQTTNVMRSNLADVQTKLASAQRDYARTEQALKASTASRDAGNVGARDVVASNTAALLNAQILTLQQQVIAYQDALGPLRSYPTTALGRAYVPVKPSTPGAVIFVIVGAAMGLVVAVGLILLENVFQKIQR